MQHSLHTLFLCLSLTLLSGCMNTTPNVTVGMTTAELQSKFGPPRHKQPAPNGGEHWYYNANVATSSYTKTNSEGSFLGIPVTGVEHSRSTVYTTQTVPITISPSGRVVEAPNGHVKSNR